MNDQPFKYRFVLGVGRSGTTFLGRLLSYSSTPMKFVSEPFPGLVKPLNLLATSKSFVVPHDSESVGKAREVLHQLAYSNDLFNPQDMCRVEREDRDPEALLIKDVHALLAYPAILEGLDYKVVVITRSTARVLDSYLSRDNRKYLVDEFEYLSSCMTGRIKPSPLIDKALCSVSEKIRSCFKRPRWAVSRFRRVLCCIEVLRHFLRIWASTDPRVIHVSHEALCVQSWAEVKGLLSFLDLGYDGSTETRTFETTSGNGIGYYETQKDSKKILNQPYKKLSKSQLAIIERYVKEPVLAE